MRQQQRDIAEEEPDPSSVEEIAPPRVGLDLFQPSQQEKR